MRRGRTLLLLAVLAIAVGAALLADRGCPSTNERRAARSRLWPELDRARLRSLEITRGVDAPIRLERDPTGWWLLEPRRRADDARVEAIVSELDFSSVERRLSAAADAVDPAPFGLAAPRFRVTALGRALSLGADAPGSRFVYASRSGERDVLVIDRRVLETLEAAADRSRLTSLHLTVSAADAARALSLGELALEQTGASWRITHPLLGRAETAAVEALIASVDKVTAARVLELASAPPGGDTLVLDGKPQARLRAGSACGQETAVARADGALLCFAPPALAPLLVSPGALREKSLVPFPTGEVQAIDLRRGERRLSLRRAGAAWRITAPAPGDADDAAVSEWLAALGSLRARSFGAAPAATSELRLATGRDEVRLVSSGRAAGRVGEPDSMWFERSLDELVDPDPLRFRPRRVLELRESAIDRIRVEAGGVVEEAERTANGFRLLRPLAIEADPAQVARLLGALSSLRAERFVPGAELRSVRVIQAIEAAGADGSVREHRIELGALDGRGCLGRVSGAPPFRLGQSACEDLSLRLATRRLLEVAGDRLSQVEVTQKGARLGVERRAGGWFAGGGPLDSAKVDALVDALSALSADEVIGYPGPTSWPGTRTTLRVRQSGEADAIVEIGPPEGEGAGVQALARVRGRAVLYRLRHSAVEALLSAIRP